MEKLTILWPGLFLLMAQLMERFDEHEKVESIRQRSDTSPLFGMP